MAEFDSWKQYSEFSYFVMRKARFILDAKNQRFLDTVVDTSAKRRHVIKQGDKHWRAQLHREIDVEVPFSRKRMIPQPDRAQEGRVNPKGIPCLYCSTDKDTAIAEMRPWIGEFVTVAKVVILKDLKVVDCSASDKLDPATFDLMFGFNDAEPEPAKREERVWADINRAFSQPVTRLDNVAEYAPTQVLAEAFRKAGYDGSFMAAGSGLEGLDLAVT